MSFRHNKNLAIIKFGLLIAGISALVAFVLKTAQIMLFFNSTTGLIDRTSVSNALNAFIIIFALVAIVACIKLTIDVTPLSKNAKTLQTGNTRFLGYTLFVTAGLFLVQGIQGFIRHTTQYESNIIKLQMLSSDELTMMQKLPEMLPIITDVLCIISGVIFVLIAITFVKNAKNRPVFLLVIPVLWSAFSLISVILAMSNTVSMQSNIDKVLVSISALLFLYYIIHASYDFQQPPKRYITIFFKSMFGLASLAFVLPYLMAFMFGIKDSDSNMPYFSLFGLVIFSFVILHMQVIHSVSFLQDNKTLDSIE